MHIFTNPCIHPCVHADIHRPMHPSMCAWRHPLTHASMDPCICPLMYPISIHQHIHLAILYNVLWEKKKGDSGFQWHRLSRSSNLDILPEFPMDKAQCSPIVGHSPLLRKICLVAASLSPPCSCSWSFPETDWTIAPTIPWFISRDEFVGVCFIFLVWVAANRVVKQSYNWIRIQESGMGLPWSLF